MAIRPLSPDARRQNAAFLRALRGTGNAREAARAVGVGRATFTRRRAKHPAFAAAWDAALVIADADETLGRCGALKGGAEPRIVALASGRRQLRRAIAGKLDRAAQQRFLLALSATANIRLAAAAAGMSHSAFYRLRERNPAFAREMRAALAQGYERLEMALLESWSPASGDDAEWRGNDPPALPPMTPAQALQLLHLHHRQVRWRETTFAGRLLPGETSDLRSARLARLHYARQAADAEAVLARDLDQAIARAERLAPPPIGLPDLAQVRGWSQADPEKTAANAGRPHGGAMREGLTEEARARGLRNARSGWGRGAQRPTRTREEH